MSHRIDIELTSNNGEVWTWRAAGAKQPKGNVEASVLYDGAGVGDVVRAEAERFLDGLRIVSVTPPRNAGARPETIEIRKNETHDGPQVRVQYADGGRGSRDRDGERRGPRPDRGPRTDRPSRDRPAADRGPRPDRPARAERPERAPRPDRVERPSRPDRPKRLSAGRAHRDALIDSLSPEQRVIADQLFRGGIPAVRQAIIDQNAARRSVGDAEVPGAALLALAEDLLPKTRAADWCDRADAALEAGSSTNIRDLRALVVQADSVAKDEATRTMAGRLRDAMTGRVEGERAAWTTEIAAALDGGKLVRALRLTTKLPDTSAKIPTELQARIIAETNQGLSPATPADRWAALVEAAAEAPFRREFVPVGLPTDASEALKETAAQASNRIPALLKVLGLTMPPPPRRATPATPPPRPVPAPPVVAPVVAATAPVATTPVPVPDVAVPDVPDLGAAPAASPAEPTDDAPASADVIHEASAEPTA